jgi:hypothetical protein
MAEADSGIKMGMKRIVFFRKVPFNIKRKQKHIREAFIRSFLTEPTQK